MTNLTSLSSAPALTVWDGGNGYDFDNLGRAIAFMIHCLRTGAPSVTLEKDHFEPGQEVIHMAI